MKDNHSNIYKYEIQPHTLSFITTFKCSASCPNCCFQCSPRKEEKLSVNDIQSIIDQVCNTFPSINICVFSGGECTLLGKELNQSIKYAHLKKLKIRIVTNGHWAKDISSALTYLAELKEIGLQEINLSTGNEHQKWIPYDNIVFACQAAVKLGLFVAVNIESAIGHNFTSTIMKQDSRIKKDIALGNIIVQDSLWIEFNKTYEQINNPNILNQGPCTNLFKTISIFPNKHAYACCGLTCLKSHILDIGNTKELPLAHIYKEQFDDLIKLWLYTHGPKSINSFLCKTKNIQDDSNKYPHMCALCNHILKDKGNMDIIKKNISNILPTVMLKFQFINQLNS